MSMAFSFPAACQDEGQEDQLLCVLVLARSELQLHEMALGVSLEGRGVGDDSFRGLRSNQKRKKSVLSSKTIIAGLKKQPDDLWGERILEIDANEVTLRRNVMTSSFKKSFIDDVVETPSGYHVLHGKIILFAIPRSACSFEELMSKLK